MTGCRFSIPQMVKVTLTLRDWKDNNGHTAEEIDMNYIKSFPFALCSFILLFSSLAFAQGTVQGVVKDNVGNGMEGVNVQVAASGETRTATTDKDGKYTIANIPAGVHTVTFEADRYVTIKRQITVPANGKVSADAAMNAEETVGVLQLQIKQPR